MFSEYATLVDLLVDRALHQPDRRVYTFLKDGEVEAESLTYQDLDRQARAIALKLQSSEAAGQRALLLYPPGLEFIAAFFGCLYAGVVAVPANPPRPNQSISRLQAIVEDAEATFALTTDSVLTNLQSWLVQNPDLAQLNWLVSDRISNDLIALWQKPIVNSDTLAFLQYTSGSTGTPKGVMVSHGNLLQTSLDLDLGWKHTKDSVIVTWLPTFHDLGLIYGVIQPLYKGCSCYMMSPVSFLLKPVRWLEAITRYKATHSAAPNFAYDLCVRKISSEQQKRLDLSSWQMALNGAEPVKPESLKQFANAFKPCGFELAAFCPGYGLAEATLKVTAVRRQDVPFFYQVQKDALRQNRAIDSESRENVQTLVGCGRSEIGTKIIIVNPDSLKKCQPEEIGEIWVSGSSVAQGYWRRSEETKQTFQAYLAGTSDGPWLRTGDLGFIKNDQLFVTGRLKDAIVIQGRNQYPQDIEMTVQKSHSAMRPGCGAAFTVEVKDEERLVVVQEVERSYLRKLNCNEVIEHIRQVVAAEHDLRVYATVLVKPGTIPKTSSGKIQRQACRSKFLNQTLAVFDSKKFQSYTERSRQPTSAFKV
jgi:acyl-CoA synthetase (AMP-forming)/AMP-acid ligase II